MEIDVKKIIGETPKNQFEAIDKMIKAQNEVLEALHIMQSAIDFPEETEFNKKRMTEYLKKFCNE